MDEEVPPRPLEDEDITAALFWTMCLLEWSTESPEASKSGVVLLVQEVLPQPQVALPLVRVHEVRGLVA
jgi:hypothetical protein